MPLLEVFCNVAIRVTAHQHHRAPHEELDVVAHAAHAILFGRKTDTAALPCVCMPDFRTGCLNHPHTVAFVVQRSRRQHLGLVYRLLRPRSTVLIAAQCHHHAVFRGDVQLPSVALDLDADDRARLGVLNKRRNRRRIPAVDSFFAINHTPLQKTP